MSLWNFDLQNNHILLGFPHNWISRKIITSIKVRIFIIHCLCFAVYNSQFWIVLRMMIKNNSQKEKSKYIISKNISSFNSIFKRNVQKILIYYMFWVKQSRAIITNKVSQCVKFLYAGFFFFILLFLTFLSPYRFTGF